MGNVIHETIPVQVWADVDVGVADLVRRLNAIPGVRTHASCQGTIGEGGAEPYEAHVMVSWWTDEARVAMEPYGLVVQGEAHGMVYPFRKRKTTTSPEPMADPETTNWQPIDTAPKDGSEIVALEPQGGAWIVQWLAGLGWQIKAVPGRDPIVMIYPTGWMPLPESEI